MTNSIYTRGSGGYKVIATSAPIRHRGGIALFYRDSPNFAVETIHQFGVSVITCQLATGDRRWYIVGYYLAPDDRTTVRDVEAAMSERPRGTELIVAGDFNVDLDKTGGRGRDKEIAATVATAGLKYPVGDFLP